ncbi:MAG: hypothetical protein PHT33_12475, partial [bacterium]|nr:hypothetical protein [bacterium]
MPQDVLIARFLSRIGVEVVSLVEEVIHSFAALDLLLYYMRDTTAQCTGKTLAGDIGRPEAEIDSAMCKMAATGIFDYGSSNGKDFLYCLASDSTWLPA